MRAGRQGCPCSVKETSISMSRESPRLNNSPLLLGVDSPQNLQSVWTLKKKAKINNQISKRNGLYPTCHLLSDRHSHSFPTLTDHAQTPAKKEEKILTPDS